MAAPKKDSVNWDAIERDFRTGVKTLRAMASEYSISHVAITKKASKEGWERDLSVRIREKAEAMVNKAMVNKVNKTEITKVNKTDLVTENQIVSVNAEIQATALLSHRKDITKHREILSKLVSELEQTTDDPESLEMIIELMVNDDPRGKAKAQKLVDLPTRMGTIERAANTLHRLIGLERQALGIDDRATQNDRPLYQTPDHVRAEIEALRIRYERV